MPNDSVTAMVTKKRKKSTGDIYNDCEKELDQLIKQIDNNGRTGREYIDFRLDQAIDSMVTAKNRMQAIIQYTSNSDDNLGDIK